MVGLLYRVSGAGRGRGSGGAARELSAGRSVSAHGPPPPSWTECRAQRFCARPRAEVQVQPFPTGNSGLQGRVRALCPRPAVSERDWTQHRGEERLDFVLLPRFCLSPGIVHGDETAAQLLWDPSAPPPPGLSFRGVSRRVHKREHFSTPVLLSVCSGHPGGP